MTAAPSQAEAVCAEARRTGIPLTRIGRMVSGAATVCVLGQDGVKLSLGTTGGWSHF